MSNQKTDLKAEENIKNDQSIILKKSPKNPFLSFYGSKLFLKCFGWFILITSVNIVLVAAYSFFYHYKPAKKEFERIASRILEDNGQIIVENYEKLGTLSEIKFRGLGNFWLYDEKLNKLFEGIKSCKTESQISVDSNNIANSNQLPPKNRKKEENIQNHNSLNNDSLKDNLKIDNNEQINPHKHHILPTNILELKKNESYQNDSFNSKNSIFPNWHYMIVKYLYHKKENNTVIDVKSPQNQLFKLKYKNFYKDNENKVLEFAKNLLNKSGTEILKIGNESFFGSQIISNNEKKYIAIIHIPSEIPGKTKFLFYKAKGVLPILMLVCAILCFFMARNFAKPIIELQEASRRFAQGDFSKNTIKNAMSRYDEIGDLAIDFNNMTERIKYGIENQNRLFHDISHELRSPLARMQVGIELLQMKVPDSEKSLVNRLEKDIDRMNALISEILQFSKLENRQIGSANEEIDLEKVLQNVCEDAEFEGNNKHKGVRLEIKDNSIIKGNYALIERAIENIVRNGLRFTAENTVVEVSLEKIENNAIIKIVDYGPGVPEDQLSKIFAPFYCINQDRNPQRSGIGLGLPIAQKAIQLHKGDIKIANKQEGGLIVTIELPI